MQSWPVHAFRGRGSGGQFITMHLHLHQYSIFHLHCTECTKTNFTLQPCNADTLQLFIQLQLCMRVPCFGLLSQTKCNYYSVRYILNTHNFPVPLFGAIQARTYGVSLCTFLIFPMNLQLYLFKAHYRLVCATSCTIFRHTLRHIDITLHAITRDCNEKIRLEKTRAEWKNEMRMDTGPQISWKEWVAGHCFVDPENNSFPDMIRASV